MRCKEVFSYLLTAESPQVPPPELETHLRACPACRRRQRRLLRLEEEIRQLPRLEQTSTARARFQQRFELLPVPTGPSLVQVSRTPTALRPQPMPALSHLVCLGLGLAVGLTLVWLPTWLFPSTNPLDTTPAGPHPALSSTGGVGEMLVSQLLEDDLHLAAMISATEQLPVLAAMSNKLQAEALRLTRAGPVEDVLLISGLYERLVYRGLLGRSQAVPAEQRPEIIASLVETLTRTATEVERTVQLAPPGAERSLLALAATARTAARGLTSPAEPNRLFDPQLPDWTPARSGTQRDLLATLVLQGLHLAEETDPLRRADLCSDLVEHLTQGILLASVGGDSARAVHLGELLVLVVDRGITPNLDRHHEQGAPEERAAEVKRIEERSNRAVESLQRHLDKAPPAAQDGLRHALEKVQGGPKHAGGKAKAKGKAGKPWPPGRPGH